jgi:hypothetical protein
MNMKYFKLHSVREKISNRVKIIGLVGVLSLFCPNLILARKIKVIDDFGLLFARDYAIQEKLVKQGLFSEPVIIDTEQISLSFVNKNVDLDVAKQIADLLLSSEERLAERGIVSEAEAGLIELHRKHFDEFSRAVQRILLRNPWSIIAYNSEGEVVGVVFSGLIWTDSTAGLPTTSAAMTRATLEQRKSFASYNTYVDFWFTAKSYKIAEAIISATFQTAQAVNKLKGEDFNIEHFYAYSNPRGLSRYPELSPEEYMRQIEEGKLRDPAINFHLKHGAKLSLIIKDAFPLITLRQSNGVVTGAIGNGCAFIMGYPRSIWDNENITNIGY